MTARSYKDPLDRQYEDLAPIDWAAWKIYHTNRKRFRMSEARDTFTMRMAPELRVTLDEVAADYGVTASEMVRVMLHHFYTHRPPVYLVTQTALVPASHEEADDKILRE